MSGYRGYRGLRRKFRAQQPCRFQPPLSRARLFSRLVSLTGVRRTPATSVFRVRGPRADPSFPAATCSVKRALYEGRVRRQPYIPDVHTGRIPVVDTYNRRKGLASYYGRDDRTFAGAPVNCRVKSSRSRVVSSRGLRNGAAMPVQSRGKGSFQGRLRDTVTGYP